MSGPFVNGCSNFARHVCAILHQFQSYLGNSWLAKEVSALYQRLRSLFTSNSASNAVAIASSAAPNPQIVSQAIASAASFSTSSFNNATSSVEMPCSEIDIEDDSGAEEEPCVFSKSDFQRCMEETSKIFHEKLEEKSLQKILENQRASIKDGKIEVSLDSKTPKVFIKENREIIREASLEDLEKAYEKNGQLAVTLEDGTTAYVGIIASWDTWVQDLYEMAGSSAETAIQNVFK